jgi:elongation factor Ts
MALHKRSFAAAISLSALKDLRAQSGAPMMECKKALESSNGDLKDAMDWLRKHGAAKASSKLAGREATEGLIGIKVNRDGNKASIVKVASETDFAGRSAAFVHLVTIVAEATMASSVTGILDEEQILESSFDNKTVKDAMDEAIVAIRENIKVSYAHSLEASHGVWVGYVHGRMENSEVAGTAAAVVHVTPKDGVNVSVEVLKDAGKKLAMHIVAAKPLYLNPETVPSEEIEREKDILRVQVCSHLVSLACLTP